MKSLNKIISIAIVLISLLYTFQFKAYAGQINRRQTPINAAVFLYSTNEILFYTRIKESFENIQRETGNKIKFTFFDSKGNQGTQDNYISQAINSGEFNLFVVTPVSRDIDELQNSVLKIVQNKIPLVVLAPPDPSLARYLQNTQSVIIGGDDEQSGILQGELIANTWKVNKDTLDKNKDNMMQYVLIQGPANDTATVARTKYSLQMINDNGIVTQELYSTPCNWDYECAKTNMESIFLIFDNKIEAIISNNDAMAIGVIETLQKYGYNKDDSSKYIPVFGINGLPQARKLIEQGIMAGTVLQDPNEYANAVYTVGRNLVYGADPLKGTNYKFDETGRIIKIPYKRYTT